MADATTPPSGGSANGVLPEHNEDAWMAHAAYDSAELDGYTIDHDLSDSHVTTYVNNGTKQATVAFAGTYFNSPGSAAHKVTHGLHDVWTDGGILVGTEQTYGQFDHAMEVTNRAIQKYGKEHIKTTGHSLGGTKALYISHKLGVPAVAFNPGWSPIQTGLQSAYLQKQWNLDKATAYVVPGDVLSTGIYLQKGAHIRTVNRTSATQEFKRNVWSAFTQPNIFGAAYNAYQAGTSLYGLHDTTNFLGAPLHPTAPKPKPKQGPIFTNPFSWDDQV